MSGMPVKARFCNGVIVPLEPLELEEGAAVTITIEEDATEADRDALFAAWARKYPDGWPGLFDEGFSEFIYEARLIGSGIDPEQFYAEE